MLGSVQEIQSESRELTVAPAADDMRWEVALPARADLGERPVWDALTGRMLWVNINAGQLRGFTVAADGTAARDDVVVDLGIPVGAAAPRRGGGYLLAAADGFRLAAADGSPVAWPGQATGGSGQPTAGSGQPAAGSGEPAGWPARPDGMGDNVRFNDGACDPAGRFWAGTVAYDRAPKAGALYRLDSDGSISQRRADVTESNGLGWSPEGTAMYYIDSGEQEPRVRVFPYDLDSGEIGDERDLITFEPGDGIPDGLIVDAEGCLWVALYGGRQLRRYSAAGGLLETVPLPVSNPTCPGFGGADLDELYVTSACQKMSAAELAAEPLAGHIFRITTSARGQQTAPYAG
jgi:sugar lactone lactonase YvrE